MRGFCAIVVTGMIFFLTALSDSQDALSAAIRRVFPSDSYAVAPDKWFIRSDAAITAKGISDKLAFGSPEAVPGSGFIVVAVSGYYGVAPPDIWEWLRSRPAIQT
jgi:sarcosine oxidase gamma subunit